VRRAPVIAIGVLTVVASAGCTAALKEPPNLDELGGGGGTIAATSEQVTSWLAAAESALAGARDAASVDHARRLFLDAARADPSRVEGFLGAARATAWLIEHEADGNRREVLAVEGVQIGQLCVRNHPDVTECSYRLALAVGQQARERPATAEDGLDVMVGLLDDVIAEDPRLDHAGGHRVLALLLLRAPGWPTGPGDPELALQHAQAAVALDPEYPPNQLVLGEAWRENDDPDAARKALEQGIRAARESRDPDAAEWIDRGRETLAELR
jgi:tetratricopeptide (TPR) repeat protein